MRKKRNKSEESEINLLIEKLYKSWGIDKKMRELDLIKAWSDLMGKGVAYRTENLSIRNKVLHIKMNSSVMRDELSFGKKVIINRVNEFAGTEIINDVWFE